MWRSKHEEKELRGEIEAAKTILNHEKVEFVPVFKNYILFKIKGDGFSIVAYPHKTSAGNRHVRVRNENSKNKEECFRIMEKLSAGSGYNCRYQYKTK